MVERLGRDGAPDEVRGAVGGVQGEELVALEDRAVAQDAGVAVTTRRARPGPDGAPRRGGAAGVALAAEGAPVRGREDARLARLLAGAVPLFGPAFPTAFPTAFPAAFPAPSAPTPLVPASATPLVPASAAALVPAAAPAPAPAPLVRAAAPAVGFVRGCAVVVVAHSGSPAPASLRIPVKPPWIVL